MVCALVTGARAAGAAVPTLHERTLPSGIRVCYLHVAGSPHFSTFSFLPMGLASDDAGRTQWAHLVEHLVIRTTMPGALTNANAETLPDHMRLDHYGSADTWREGLTHHAKWLGGLSFTDASVRDEPARANGETEFAAKALATHKFATAAWNQVARHGKQHAPVKGDLLNVDRKALEAYRDARLVVRGRTLICMVGGAEPAEVLAGAAEMLGTIQPAGKPFKGEAAKVGDFKATWDLDASHVLLAWPIPGAKQDVKAHAALSALARLVWVKLAQDAEMQKLIGQPIVGTDLRCPASSYFFISAGCKPGVDRAEVRKRMAECVAAVGAKPEVMVPAREIGRALAAELALPDPDRLGEQVPPGMKPGLIEAQVALTWASAEYRLEGRRNAFVQALNALTAEQLRKAADKYLRPEVCSSVELRPAGPAPGGR